MKITFRVDASLKIGIGHVMRCLTLAEQLKLFNVDCHFICREHPGNLISLIKEKGYKATSLPYRNIPNPDYDNDRGIYGEWLGTDWKSDAKETNQIIKDENIDWLVVDHYSLDDRWEAQVKDNCRYLMVIDDLADRKHDCDLLLDQTLLRKEDAYKNLVPASSKLLIGSKYALLRSEFKELREVSIKYKESPKLDHLLISMGGVDKDNVTGEMLSALDLSSLPDECTITTVIGKDSPWAEALQKQASNIRFKVEIMINVTNMAELMSKADFAIGAAGTTSWERCCLGLPSVVVPIADNQKEIANALQKSGAAFHLHLSNIDDVNKQIYELIEKLLSNSQILKTMSEAAFVVTSGEGAEIVTNYFLGVNNK